MERVVCVSHAKVPIVKIWDPELRLACDMNVNNTLALENTRMIRTYVEADERVRPLAMSVKHWTKRRVLNDAGSGGTLSSYTWICLYVNFLQTRDPPILPSLQARPHKERKIEGLECGFDDDPKSFAGFGRKNTQSVGELFFEFFRYYGHEINYEENVISVREGTLISKVAKKWHLATNNRLCVEEPFNTDRNLGNTADDTSFRGLHMELRRAFKYVSQGDLKGCCEQFEFPPEEERTWERPPPQPRHGITPTLPTRGGRGSGRGGARHVTGQLPARGGFNGGRRASNTGGNNKGINGLNGYRLPTANAPELSLQAQQQAQYLLHDQLYQQIQILQAQEQELRMQLHNQAMITGRQPPVLLRQQPFIHFPVPQQQEFSGDENSRSRSGTINSHSPITPGPLTPGPRQQSFFPTYASVSASGTQASSSATNPPSPGASTIQPDLRRNPRRASVVNGTSPKASLRAQSQPARSQNSPSFQHFTPLYPIPQPLDTSFASRQRTGPESLEEGDGSEDESTPPPNSLPSNGSGSDSVDESRSQDFLGYYPTPQQLQLHQQVSMLSPLAGALPNGYASAYLPVQSDYRPAAPSSDAQSTRSEQTPTGSSRSPAPPQRRSTSRPATVADRGPLIVDGSVPPSESRSSYMSDLTDSYTTVTNYTSTSEEQNINTPASYSDSLSQDFQDSGPFEMDQSGFSRPPNSDAQKSTTNGYGESPTDKAKGQTELLASRLQNYHLSNAERLAQAHASNLTKPNSNTNGNRANASQQGPKETTPAKGPPASNEKNSANNQGNENRQQTPNKRRPNGVEASEKPNGANHNHGHHSKSKPKGRNDNSYNSPADSKDRHNEHPPRKTNGPANGTSDSHSSTWQTTKKKHRKSAKPSADPRNGVNGGAELLPVDESQRKGG